MSDDDTGVAGGGGVGDGTEIEGEPVEVDGGGAFALTDQVRDSDLLRAEALGDAHGPFSADGGPRIRGLSENMAGRCRGGVETVFEVEAEAEGAGFLAGFGDGKASEVGNSDLVAVDGEAHREKGGDERYQNHGHGAEEDVEESIDG